MGDAATAVAHVLADAELAGGWIFRPRLPDANTDQMPRDAIIIRRAGGGQLASGYMPTVDSRIDVRCYGASPAAALDLDVALVTLLHNLRAVDTPAGRIMWCRLSSGSSDQIEPQTAWPFVLSTWQIYGDWLSDG